MGSASRDKSHIDFRFSLALAFSLDPEREPLREPGLELVERPRRRRGGVLLLLLSLPLFLDT